ncbi:MAG: DUF2933 domain-containing protein [Xanthobacteraceae bacterium]|nr:DUF2933 domain-containing protein [Xanthobacteraceae bacterium]
MPSLRLFLGSKLGLLVCLGLAALGVYLLWTHTGHVLSALPYVVLLACPLLHLFGHGHGHRHPDDDNRGPHGFPKP